MDSDADMGKALVGGKLGLDFSVAVRPASSLSRHRATRVIPGLRSRKAISATWRSTAQRQAVAVPLPAVTHLHCRVGKRVDRSLEHGKMAAVRVFGGKMEIESFIAAHRVLL